MIPCTTRCCLPPIWSAVAQRSGSTAFRRCTARQHGWRGESGSSAAALHRRSSPTAVHYALRDLAEARAYLAHPILGPRLQECFTTVLGVRHRTAHEIFGSPDDLKFRSCARLFALVATDGSVFHQALDTFFAGEPDPVTRRLLKAD